MGNADCVREDRPVYIGIMRNIDAAYKLDEISRLSPKMRLFGINGFAYKIDGHGIFSHFRCALIPYLYVYVKNYHALHMRDNSLPAHLCPQNACRNLGFHLPSSQSCGEAMSRQEFPQNRLLRE
ncbi:hypothetical protein [uncultured Roseobacter sp.]|uniref:hypothetical protein n=1 Tax=uncultured Roseobacter sp. TaxID=114847 RepID=UPI00261C1B3A|nr:hypothetical protein [uncultured Roseobacter sp.]